MPLPRREAAAQQVLARGDRHAAALTVAPDGDEGEDRDLAGRHHGVDRGQRLGHRRAVRLLRAVVRHVALVEDVGVDVEVDHVAAVGERGDGLAEVRSRVAGGRRGDHHVGGPNQLVLVGVEVPDVDHHDPVGGQRHALVREGAPLGVGESGGDRHRHSAEHAGGRGARRVEVAVGIEPDEPEPDVRAERLLDAADDAGDERAVAAGNEHRRPGTQAVGHRVGDFPAEEADVGGGHVRPQRLGEAGLGDARLAEEVEEAGGEVGRHRVGVGRNPLVPVEVDGHDVKVRTVRGQHCGLVSVNWARDPARATQWFGRLSGRRSASGRRRSCGRRATARPRRSGSTGTASCRPVPSARRESTGRGRCRSPARS